MYRNESTIEDIKIDHTTLRISSELEKINSSSSLTRISNTISITPNRRRRRKPDFPKQSPPRDDPDFVGVTFKIKVMDYSDGTSIDYDTQYELVYMYMYMCTYYII